MNECACRGCAAQFDDRVAARDLRRYRRSGPPRTTRALLDAVAESGASGKTLLDIGGGIGAVQHELMSLGFVQGVAVEASAAYLQAAAEEGRRRGIASRMTYHQGDFVHLAPQIGDADVVTLDRVICCYPDLDALIGLSAARARHLYGLVYPRERWWLKLAFRVVNLVCRLRHHPFRIFLHPARAIDALVASHGLAPRFHENFLVWQVVLYEREVRVPVRRGD